MSLITDSFHKKKLDSYKINIKTNYIECISCFRKNIFYVGRINNHYYFVFLNCNSCIWSHCSKVSRLENKGKSKIKEYIAA